jgi:hypothetical protein
MRLMRHDNKQYTITITQNNIKFAADEFHGIDRSEQFPSVSKTEHLAYPICCRKCNQWKMPLIYQMRHRHKYHIVYNSKIFLLQYDEYFDKYLLKILDSNKNTKYCLPIQFQVTSHSHLLILLALWLFSKDKLAISKAICTNHKFLYSVFLLCYHMYYILKL